METTDLVLSIGIAAYFAALLLVLWIDPSNLARHAAPKGTDQ